MSCVHSVSNISYTSSWNLRPTAWIMRLAISSSPGDLSELNFLFQYQFLVSWSPHGTEGILGGFGLCVCVGVCVCMCMCVGQLFEKHPIVLTFGAPVCVCVWFDLICFVCVCVCVCTPRRMLTLLVVGIREWRTRTLTTWNLSRRFFHIRPTIFSLHSCERSLPRWILGNTVEKSQNATYAARSRCDMLYCMREVRQYIAS